MFPIRTRRASANISARINGELITVADDNGINTEVVNVKFVQEAILPTRRRRSKPSGGMAINTGNSSDREPGNK